MEMPRDGGLQGSMRAIFSRRFRTQPPATSECRRTICAMYLGVLMMQSRFEKNLVAPKVRQNQKTVNDMTLTLDLDGYSRQLNAELLVMNPCRSGSQYTDGRA